MLEVHQVRTGVRDQHITPYVELLLVYQKGLVQIPLNQDVLTLRVLQISLLKLLNVVDNLDALTFLYIPYPDSN